MKLRTVLPMIAVTAFALAACAPKVTYSEFHEKAVEAAKKANDVSYSKVVVDGYEIDEDGKKQEWDQKEVRFEKGAFTTKSALLSDPAAYADELIIVAMLTALRAENMPEEEDCTYYAGGSFKIVEEADGKKNTIEFNDLGLMTSMQGDDGKLTVKYSK